MTLQSWLPSDLKKNMLIIPTRSYSSTDSGLPSTPSTLLVRTTADTSPLPGQWQQQQQKPAKAAIRNLLYLSPVCRPHALPLLWLRQQNSKWVSNRNSAWFSSWRHYCVSCEFGGDSPNLHDVWKKSRPTIMIGSFWLHFHYQYCGIATWYYQYRVVWGWGFSFFWFCFGFVCGVF